MDKIIQLKKNLLLNFHKCDILESTNQTEGTDCVYSNRACLSEKNDLSQPLTIKVCGHYRTYIRPYGASNRASGRSDYHIIYVVSGKVHFVFDEKNYILPAGNMVLYRPGEPQYYRRYAEDKPEAYWIHFSGNDVANILKDCNLSNGNIFDVGVHPEINTLFSQIIEELQKRKKGFDKIAALHLETILRLASRYISTNDADTSESVIDNSPTTNLHHEMSLAAAYFNEHYMEDINIEEYAKTHNMSTSTFIKKFKRWIGSTPSQHIISARIASAQLLLENTDYDVAHIAELVGYNDSLYFSRLFSKRVGMPPLKWRKTRR